MKTSITLTLLPALLAATTVSAHGFLSSLTIAGTSYKGNVPQGAKNPSVIRQVSSPSPNHGAANPALTCGPDSTPGSLIADANPGDALTFNWRGADGSKWPHNIGPMMTYMASCGSTTCDKFDITKAQWFKISEDGRKSDDSPDWVQLDLFNGGVAKSQIPSTLAPGNYLLRHEIIALHLATSPGLAEFYPACAQLRVGGSGTATPSPNELVSIPGAYKDTDPGIYDKDIFSPDVPYIMPGPAVAKLAGGSGSGSGSSGSGSGSGSGTSSAAPATKTNSTKSGSKQCKLKKSKRAADSTDDSATLIVRPRHLSRVMRGLGLNKH